MKKGLFHKKSIYFILLIVLFLIILFSTVMIFQTKEYIGKAYAEYFQKNQITEQQQVDLAGEAYRGSSGRQSSSERESQQKQNSRKPASKPGASNPNNLVNGYTQDEIANCIAQQSCTDKMDNGKNEFLQGTLLYYNPKLKDCVTATDSCKTKNILIEYSCDNYAASKQKGSLNLFDPITCQYGCNAKESRCYTKTEADIGNCFDGIKNQNEEQIDCGGVCQKCPSCNDFKLDQNELFVDCGGSCPACNIEKTNHCTNKIQDADELGIDCGGLNCGPCKEDINQIYPNQCKNNIKDANEEQIDCGGPCPPCGYNPPAKTIYPDHCKNNLFDKGTEEDIDCGKECPACIIQPQATCFDGIKNQDEEKVDCGGKNCPICSIVDKDCIDSDADTASTDADVQQGKSIYVPGHLTLKTKTDPVYDSCDADILKEKYCDATGEATKIIKCSNGCKQTAQGGYCQKLYCDDQDVNADSLTVTVLGVEVYSYDYKYSIPSSAVQTNQDGAITDEKKDVCLNSDSVNEAYCNGNKPDYEIFTCPKESYGHKIFDGCANGVCCSNKDKCADSDENETNKGINLFEKGVAQKPQICLSPNPTITKIDSCGTSYCTAKGDSIAVLGENGYNCPTGTERKIENIGAQYGDLIQEYSCSSTNIQSAWYSCPEGQACLSGACQDLICLDTDVKEQKPELIAGSTTGIGFEKGIPTLKTFNDYCVDKNTLKEFKCGNKNIDYPDKDAVLISDKIYAVYDYINCPGKCQAGKCTFDLQVKDQFATCTDSDSSSSSPFNTKGFITIIHPANPPKYDPPVWDSCVEGEKNILEEWTCKDGGSPIFYTCENGCFGGKCV